MIELIVVDAEGTLGLCTGPNTTDILNRLSPLPKNMVAEEYRRVLHRAALTEDRIAELCTVLHIDPELWPQTWPEVGFRLYDYAPTALAGLAKIAPTVVLSNMDSASGPSRMRQLANQCSPHIRDTWTSYGMGTRKPDPALWKHLAEVYEVDTSAVVHIGDSFAADVHGPIRAGCNAVYLETRLPAPDLWDWPDGPGKIAVADNLLHAVEDVAAIDRGHNAFKASGSRKN